MAALLLMASVTLCVQVKEYQKNRINDAEMELSTVRLKKMN
jgi:hypothetical protein